MATKNRLGLFYGLLILFFALFIMGCTRTNADQAVQEMSVPAIKDNSSSSAVFAVEFAAVKYVTARDGLTMRESPSASSNRLGRFGLKEGHGLFFRWALEETKLTARLLADEVIDGIEEVGIWEIIVTVINCDRIILDFIDGRPQRILARNSDVF